ncbi:sulfurtransferase TusA family protein [Vibrio gallicus]|uniref:sulfurtransferase TusA family protein n=1 Tax=Vibrio gallicus TaxID=190897 RepID=UPI0021C470F5|nr:sulfurtransferase TusA family protein [Vibrio gallicus]
MRSSVIDLTEHRCPMSLLLAKRASLELTVGESIKFMVTELSSIEDMIRYFSSNQWHTQLERTSDCYHLTIIKE